MADDDSKHAVGKDSGGMATPHRSKRINLGTPANYYFKYVNSSKKGDNYGVNVSKHEGDTGTFSIPGFNLGGGQTTESSFLSLAGSSVSGSDGSDLLNKSTLSDTTELTASNFVLVTTSKQNMIRQRISHGNANKENSKNTKNNDLKTEGNVARVDDNIELTCPKKSFHDDGDTTISAEAENKTERSVAKKEIAKIEENTSQLISIKDASPSLRSRISSSPASLRKFHENLKNSRIQRQLRREEDTKRRFSSENKNSLHSMDVQLEALTNEPSLKRKRLPPSFLNLTQQAQSQRSSMASSSRHFSPSQSDTDSTSVNMDELNDLLGIKNTTMEETESSATARYSSIQRLLCEDNPQENLSEKEQTESLTFQGHPLSDDTLSPIKTSKTSSNDSGCSDASNVAAQSHKPTSFSTASPPSSPPSVNVRSTAEVSHNRMTPTKLSSAAKRVVNPQSIFSPAKNTRSAKKRRKLQEGNQESNLSYLQDVANGSMQLSGHHISSSTSELSNISDDSNLHVSIENGSAHKPCRRSSEGNDPGSSFCVKSNDTASLGDIADIFGTKPIGEISQELRLSPSRNDHFNEASKEANQQFRDNQETASIGDINGILNDFPISQESPGKKLDAIKTTPNDDYKNYDVVISDQNAVEGKLESANLVEMETQISEQSIPNEYKGKYTSDSTEGKVLPTDSATDILNESINDKGSKKIASSLSGNVRKSLENHSDSPSVNEDNIKSLNDSNIDQVNSKTTRQSPTTPKNVRSEEIDHNVENKSCGVNLSKSFPRSSARLTPKSLRKPTPTKLAPTPQRVLNPNNTNSVTRNVRRRPSAETPNQTCASNQGLLRSGKYAHTSNTESDSFLVKNKNHAHRNEEVASPVHIRDPLPLFGILSSKKKGSMQRSVAFGSPEAAEYNIGSPSVNFTPMPKGRAKALFSVERYRRNEPDFQESLNLEKSDVSNCIESESEMNVLVDKMTVERMQNSPALSPIAKTKADTDAFKVPSEKLSLSSPQFLANGSMSILSQENSCNEERTVELETGMKSLLEYNLKASKNTFESQSNDTSSVSQSDSKEDSIELADSRSIASIHSRSEKYTGNFEIQTVAQKKLDFSFAVKASLNNSQYGEEKEGITVELEHNMLSLLKATENDVVLKKDQQMSKQKVTSIDSLSVIAGDSNSISRDTEGKEGKTVELEGNIISLLQATKNDGLVEEQKLNDTKTDMTLGSDQSAISDSVNNSNRGTQHRNGGNNSETVELEGNMLSLLKSTTEEENAAVEMDVEDDSVSSIMENFKSDKKKVNEEKNTSIAENKAERYSFSSENGEKETRSDFGSPGLGSIKGNSKITAKEKNDGHSETIELEGNMFSLLEAATSTKSTSSEREKKRIANQMDMIVDSVSLSFKGAEGREMDSSNTGRIDFIGNIDHKARHGTSLSSSSFTLSEVEEGQISVNHIIAEQKSFLLDKSVSFCDTKEFITNLSTQFRPTDSPPKEFPIISVDLLTEKLFRGLKDEEIQQDGLSECFTQFIKSNDIIDTILSERWGQFTAAVCGEVERRTDSEGTATKALSALVEEDPIFYNKIQKRLELNDDAIEKSLYIIIEKGKILVDYEFNCWLTTVLESFHGPLNDITSNFEDDSSQLKETLQCCNMLQNILSSVKDKKSARARRKSFLRSQRVVADLTQEIEIIESQLQELKSELHEIEEEEGNIFKSKTEFQNFHLNAKKCHELTATAKSAQKSLLSLRGLHSWSMGTVSLNDMEFFTIGSCSQTNLKVLYDGASFDKAQKVLSSKVDSDCVTRPMYVYHGAVSVFLDSSIKRLMQTSQWNSQERPIRMSEHLQNYSWLIGRLDLLAKEFQVVQHRYNGKLRRTNRDKEEFSFLVEFENVGSKIVVEFEIEPIMYPSFPVKVHLDLISGQADMVELRTNLRKNAKPGFGSITRACDIVQSTIRK